MPSRLIRDEMLESEAILSLPVEARWFYVTILLSADDVGLFEATAFKLARRADIRRESGEAYLGMLVDAGLVRLYEVDGKRFGFIPRFRQRLQIKRTRYPVPPLALLQGDDDALNKIKALADKKTVVQPLRTRCAAVAQPPEPEPEPEPEYISKNNPNKERERTARGTRLDPAMQLPDDWREYCKANRPDLDAAKVFENFRDYWIAKSGQNSTKLDWAATWRTWVRHEKQQRAGSEKPKLTAFRTSFADVDYGPGGAMRDV